MYLVQYSVSKLRSSACFLPSFGHVLILIINMSTEINLEGVLSLDFLASSLKYCHLAPAQIIKCMLAPLVCYY